MQHAQTQVDSMLCEAVRYHIQAESPIEKRSDFWHYVSGTMSSQGVTISATAAERAYDKLRADLTSSGQGVDERKYLDRATKKNRRQQEAAQRREADLREGFSAPQDRSGRPREDLEDLAGRALRAAGMNRGAGAGFEMGEARDALPSPQPSSLSQALGGDLAYRKKQ